MQFLQKASRLRELSSTLRSKLGDFHRQLPPFSPGFSVCIQSAQTPAWARQGGPGSRDVCRGVSKSNHRPQTNEHQDTPTNPDCIAGPPEPNSFPPKRGKLEGSVRGPRPLPRVDVSFAETGKACARKPGRCRLQVGAVHGGRCLKGSCLASPLALGMNEEQLRDCQSRILRHAGLFLNRPRRGPQPGWLLLCHFPGNTSQLVQSKGARPPSVLGLVFCKVPRERSAPKTICLGFLCQFS